MQKLVNKKFITTSNEKLINMPHNFYTNIYRRFDGFHYYYGIRLYVSKHSKSKKQKYRKIFEKEFYDISWYDGNLYKLLQDTINCYNIKLNDDRQNKNILEREKEWQNL